MTASATPSRGRRLAALAFLRPYLRQLLAWPLAALLLTLVVWALSDARAERERAALLAAGVTDARALAAAYSQQLHRTVEQIDQITLNLRYYWNNSGGRLRLEDQQRAGLYPLDAMLYATIAGRDGAVLTSTLSRRQQRAMGDRDYFLAHRANSDTGLQITQLEAGRNSGKLDVRFSRRIDDPDGAFSGVVMVSVEPSYLATFNSQATLGQHGFLSVRGQDGKLFASKMGHQLGDHPAIYATRPVFPHEPGSAVHGGAGFADGHARIVAWHGVTGYPLVAVAGLAQDEVLEPLAARVRGYQLTAITLTLLLMTLAAGGMALTARAAWRRHQTLRTRQALGTVAETGADGFFAWRALPDRRGAIADFQLADCNEGGARMYGLQKAEMLDRKLSSLYPDPAYFGQLRRTFTDAMAAGFHEDEVRMDPSSKMDAAWLHRRMARTADGVVMTLRDISEQRAHEAALSAQADTDALTQLPNRHWLMQHLPRAIDRGRSGGHALALLFVDLDDFKYINDTLGHAAGDELLRAAAGRLRSLMRPDDRVARLGGDEFTVILEYPLDRAIVAGFAGRMIAALNTPFVLEGSGGHVVRASIGISMYPRDGADAETLLKHADIAMYEAKARGKGSYCFFEAALSERLVTRLALVQALTAAIESGAFELHYQPRVDAVSGELRSMEALVRWRHPDRGLVGPPEFIALAEETGLIVPLGELVLRQACAQLAAWKAGGVPLVPLSINVSPRQFDHGGMAQLFDACMRQHGVPPALIEIEVTESSMMGEGPGVAGQLSAIKALGIRLSVDDFGTGYSSLSQLQRLDLDVLKMDRSFTAGLGKSPEAEVLFEAVISMALVLRLEVVAEGVETQSQLDALRRMGCREVQGYYISRPVPAAEMALIMRRGAAGAWVLDDENLEEEMQADSQV
ncbi:MAG: EAL domain-containing protein [Noviherbaspirillum sp.]